MLFGAGAGVLAAATLIGTAQAQPAADTPDAALNRLLEGNARYVSNQLRERDFSAGATFPPAGPPARKARRRSPRSSAAPIRGSRRSWPSTRGRATCSWFASPATS
jgi:hypothetical protein